MKTSIYNAVAAGFVATLAFAPLSYANVGPMGSAYGSPGAGHFIDRVITIMPGTKWVNVKEGHTVKFVDANTGKSFTWHFDIGNGWPAFALNKVAPKGVLGAQHVEAYVATRNRVD